MGENEGLSSGIFCYGGGIFGRHMEMFFGQLAVFFKVCAFAQQEFSAFGDIDGALAITGIADVGKNIAVSEPAYLVQGDLLSIDNDEALFGNGKPGLLADVHDLKEFFKSANWVIGIGVGLLVTNLFQFFLNLWKSGGHL